MARSVIVDADYGRVTDPAVLPVVEQVADGRAARPPGRPQLRQVTDSHFAAHETSHLSSNANGVVTVNFDK